MATGTTAATALYRTEKWEIKMTPEQEQLLLRISDGLREIYNRGLEQWVEEYKKYREEKKSGVLKPSTKLPTLFDQINQLTELGVQDRRAKLFRASIPRNWKEETLDALHGALGSFFSLVKKGDRDARPPRPRNEKYFSAVPGRSGFSLKRGQVVFAPNIFGAETLAFSVPARYQAGMLARATKIKKFVITRDEPSLAKPGRYWVSVSYEIKRPEQTPFIPEKAAYVALGASYIGVVSPKGEEIIELGRPDRYWKPIADAVNERMDRCAKGSRSWCRRNDAKHKMYRKMAQQQKLGRREVVAHRLLKHGAHFVVTDLVVRSKKGKLADAQKPERGGALGLNWSAQNTGAIGYLVQWLEEKVAEHGGAVYKHRLPPERVPAGQGRENKILMARALRSDFLASL